jgi:hypothetical protein
MSSKQSYLDKGRTEEQYQKWASEVGRKIDFQKKLRRLVDSCQSPWSILKRMKDLAQPSYSDEDLERNIHSSNPMQLLSDYQIFNALADNPVDSTGFIANHVSKIKESCFCRWGDRNSISSEMRRIWFSDRALEVDVAAQELSEISGVTIAPEEIIEFVCQHPKGPKTYLVFDQIRQIEEAFYRLTGFRLSTNFIKKFNQEMMSKEPIEPWVDVPF